MRPPVRRGGGRVLFLALFLAACALEGDDCYPHAAVPADRVLTADDDCGAWALTVDEHLVVVVDISHEGVACEADLPGVAALSASPIYTAFSDTGPRWTFDLVARSQGEGEAAITCDDGASWRGWLVVE